ncbi:MAG: hypothetical protein L3J05_03550 [Robiginitomaculum sp.]|nr:hypothetical protein [Robiginitomaculum sp.]
MLMFMAALVFQVELAVIASGLFAFYKAKKEDSKALKWAGWILTIGGVSGVLCTSYFSLRYMSQGAFDMAEITQILALPV